MNTFLFSKPNYLNGFKFFTENIRVENNQKKEIFISGTQLETNKKFILIKINLSRQEKIEKEIQIKNYFINLERCYHKNLVKYLGIYYNQNDSCFYLTFESPTHTFYSFYENYFKNFTMTEKFVLTSQLLQLFKFFYDKQENNPLVRNWKFYFIDENLDNTDLANLDKSFTFKFLNIGEILSLNDIDNVIINLPVVIELYRYNLLDQKCNIQKLKYSQSSALMRFYLETFAKILMMSFNKIVKVENKNKNVNEMPVFIKNFIFLYTNPNIEEIFDKEKGNIMEKALHDFKACIKNNFKFHHPIKTNITQNELSSKKIINLSEKENLEEDKEDDFYEDQNSKKNCKNEDQHTVIKKKRKRLSLNFSEDEDLIDLTLDEKLQENSEISININGNKNKVTMINLIQNETSKESENLSSVVESICLTISTPPKSTNSDDQERLDFMEKNFPVFNKEIITFYKKQIDEDFSKYTIQSKDLPKIDRKIYKSRNMNENNNIHNFIVSDLGKPNYNISINMTNFILNNENFIENVITGIDKITSKNKLINNIQQPKLNENKNVMKKIWCCHVLNEEEGINKLFNFF